MPQKGVQPEWLKGKGGRPKGSPTKFKREAWESLHSQLNALEFDCLGTAVALIKSRRTPISEKTRLICQILSLQFPKVQAIAVTRNTHTTVSMADLIRNPKLVKAMEAASIELEQAKVGKLLPAPGLPILEAEPVDEPAEPSDGR